MNILFLTNNDISMPLARWLEEKNNSVICSSKPIDLKQLGIINPDIVISYNYKHIIPKNVIVKMKKRIINLHISLLPWNRGSYPNFWSFVENTPKGVSIICIDEGIDTGEILFNKEVNFNEVEETFYSSYLKLHEEIQNLFKENWKNIKKWNVNLICQPKGGNVHYDIDYQKLIRQINEFDWNMNINEFKKMYRNINKI